MSKICDICKEINSGENWVFKLSDEKEFREYNGHQECVDTIYAEYKSINNHSTKSVKQVLQLLKGV